MTMPARSGVIQGSLANSVDSFKVCNPCARCCNAPGCPQTHSLPSLCLQCTVDMCGLFAHVSSQVLTGCVPVQLCA